MNTLTLRGIYFIAAAQLFDDSAPGVEVKLMRSADKQDDTPPELSVRTRSIESVHTLLRECAKVEVFFTTNGHEQLAIAREPVSGIGFGGRCA